MAHANPDLSKNTILHSCWYSDKICPYCLKQLATNGKILWCEEHCEYKEKSDQEMK